MKRRVQIKTATYIGLQLSGSHPLKLPAALFLPTTVGHPCTSSYRYILNSEKITYTFRIDKTDYKQYYPIVAKLISNSFVPQRMSR